MQYKGIVTVLVLVCLAMMCLGVLGDVASDDGAVRAQAENKRAGDSGRGEDAARLAADELAIVIDGSSSEWGSVPHTSRDDGFNDGLRNADPAPYKHPLAGGDDFLQLRYASDTTSVYATTTMKGPSSESAPGDLAYFIVPSGGTDRGYEFRTGVFAVAMMLNGIGYVYDGPGTGTLWAWKALA